MKKSLTWLSLSEVIVSITIFSLLIMTVITVQGGIVESTVIIDKELKIKRFWNYVWDIVKNISVPVYSDGQVFYVSQDYDDQSLFSFDTTDSLNSELPIWFFRESENFPYYHKITKNSENTIWSTTYITYEIEVWYGDDVEKYYVIK